MENNEKTVLTPYEVAAKLGISLPLTYKQLRSGTIPSVKVGDRYLIPQAAFDKWLECQPKQPAQCIA